MGFESTCVVIKFHDGEKYAARMCSGTKNECISKAAYYRGLFHDDKDVKFGVYPASQIDFLQDAERRGGDSLYNSLTNSSQL